MHDIDTRLNHVRVPKVCLAQLDTLRGHAHYARNLLLTRERLPGRG